jgi:hypothetical protein
MQRDNLDILKTGLRNHKAMAILDNFENWIFQDELPFETKPVNDSLAMKIFSDTCCHGCYCQSEKDHQQESR